MNSFLRGFGGVLGAVAIVGAGAGMAYGVATVIGGSSSGDEAQVQETVAPAPTADASASPAASASPSEKSRRVEGMLLTDNRDALRICVQVIDLADAAAKEADAVTDVELAMSEVRTHPRWVQALSPGQSETDSAVKAGCPVGPAYYDARAGPSFGEQVGDNRGRCVNSPSPYLVHMYVLPEEEILRIVGPSENYHGGPEEFICGEGGVSVWVTTGLYFSPTELRNPAVVTRDMEFAIGLR